MLFRQKDDCPEAPPPDNYFLFRKTTFTRYYFGRKIIVRKPLRRTIIFYSEEQLSLDTISEER